MLNIHARVGQWVLQAASTADHFMASAEGSGPMSWSAKEVEMLWESVPRPLLKLGQAGAQETHLR